MRKLDRLGWAVGESVSCYGVRLGLRTDDPRLLARMHACLPPGWKPSPAREVDLLYSLRSAARSTRPGVRTYNLLYAAHDRIARSMEMDEVLEALESDLALFVAERAPRRVFVHAGVVGWQGRAILLPGRSHAGKTSLVAALLRAGAEYYSDEYAVLDVHGRVHPFPRDLSIRQGPEQKPRRHPPGDLGGKVGSRPLPVALVAASKYQEGAVWRPQVLSTGQTVLALLAQTVSARRYPDRALTFLTRATQQAVGLRGKRGEAEAVAADLLERVTRAAA